MMRGRSESAGINRHRVGNVTEGLGDGSGKSGRGRLSVNRIRAASTAKIVKKCAIIFD